VGSPQINMRWPRAIEARVTAQCERRGMTRTEYVMEALVGLLECDEQDKSPPQGPGRMFKDSLMTELAPKPPPPEKARPPAADASAKPPKVREALTAAEARVGARPAVMAGAGVSVAAAMAKMGTYVHDGEKRAPYQKGQGTQAKRRR
jgi:hypothetical protein